MKGPLAAFALMVLAGVSLAAAKRSTESSKASDAWLLSFAGKSTYDLGKDPRFRLLLRRELSQHDRYALHWGATEALPEEIMYLLGNYPGKTVTVTSGRFVEVSMDFPGAGTFEGLLWCDVVPNQRIKMIFVFLGERQVRGEEDVADDLDVYVGRGMADSALPPQLLSDVHAWEMGFNIGSVKNAVLYDAQNHSESLAASVFSTTTQ
jgi:hypothetical protein